VSRGVAAAPAPRRRRAPLRDDDGSSIVEFHFLGLLLLVPLVYVMLAVLEVQSAAYGTTQAAREAGRLFVATGNEAAARSAAAIALQDQGIDAGAATVRFTCSVQPCYAPGSRVTVSVSADVLLPFLPDVFAEFANARVPVSATHSSVVDRFGEAG
jgi:Flp pilus assembly protein TadG